LPPNEYIISISKDGRQKWGKTIKVVSEKVNIIKNIILFKKNAAPTLIYQGQIENFIYSPNNQNLIFQQTQNNGDFNFKIYNELTNIFSNIKINDNNQLIDFVFSNKNKNLLIKTGGKNYIYNFALRKIIDLEQKISNIKIKNLLWDRQSDYIIYFNDNKKIYRFNLLDYKLDEIYIYGKSSDFFDFDIINNSIYLLTVKNDKTVLIEIDQNNKNRQIKLLDLSQLNFKFQDSPEYFLAIMDKKSQKLTVINTDTKKIIINDNAANIVWSKKIDGYYRLAYNNDYEIYIYDFKANKKNLIGRYSEEVKQIAWYGDFNHLLFQVGETLKITDLDYKEKNIQILADKIKINNFSLNFNSGKIYFNGETGGQKGLFELEIF
ncbi:hypothetical protein KAI52_04280, partial [Candidatus Parcubacteria bacterium]|nr:hypothetical protein [Candidatus Parcubacteria bacterium]